ncbi:hypothetical protein D9M68_842640 [compost metagenome]
MSFSPSSNNSVNPEAALDFGFVTPLGVVSFAAAAFLLSVVFMVIVFMINMVVKLLPTSSDWLYGYNLKFYSKHLLIIELHFKIL